MDYYYSLQASSAWSGIGVKLIFYAWLTLHCHRLLLRGGKAPMVTALRTPSDSPLAGPMGPFMWKLLSYWAFWACSLAASAWVLYSVVPVFERFTIASLLVIALIPAALIDYVVLGLFGTVLPAAAVLEDASYSTALRRGRLSFWRTFSLLIAGSGAFFLLSMTAAGLLYFGLAGISESVADVLSEFVGELMGMFGILLAATALCLAYEDGNTEEAPAETTS